MAIHQRKGTFKISLESFPDCRQGCRLRKARRRLSIAGTTNDISGRQSPLIRLQDIFQERFAFHLRIIRMQRAFGKAAAFLKQKFAGIDTEDETPPVFYCGSGRVRMPQHPRVHIATGKECAPLPGSWSEWINYYPAVTGP